MSLKDQAHVTDQLAIAMDRAREMSSGLFVCGFGVVELWRGDRLLHAEGFNNLVTTAGDNYYAAKAVAAIAPASPSAPTAATGMKLGSGSTGSATKTQAGLTTYISGSNNPFDATFPDVVDETGDTGASARYKTTWAAADTTAADIDEVALVNDASTDADSTAANTYSYAVFTTINKTSSDSLAITWKHLFLGA